MLIFCYVYVYRNRIILNRVETKLQLHIFQTLSLLILRRKKQRTNQQPEYPS